MPRLRHVRILLGIGLLAGLLQVTIGPLTGAMAARSIQGQEGWSGGTIPVSTSIDQTIDQSGLNQRTGTGTWRISNSTSLGNYNGNFAGWPFSPDLPVSAGQPSSGAVADQFTATLWFRSASAVADGSNIEIDLGSVPGDDRNTFLALTNRADADGGLQLRVSEPDGATGNFRPTAIIAPAITRNVWHRLDITARFLDGQANDTVEYALDGAPLANPAGGTTFGTFEGWRDGLDFAYVLSNRLFFRSGAAPSAFGAFADTTAQGFYFDDLLYFAAAQSAPAVRLAAYVTGFEPPAIPAPDLTLLKSHAGNFTHGQIGAAFTVTVTNIGSASTAGVVTLTDAVPTGLTPASASGTGWACGISGAAVTCTRSDALASGASYPLLTITVNVATSAPASVANTATISGGGETHTANNSATDVATIIAAVDLAITKTDGLTTYTPGTAIAYTISVTNAGPSAAAGFSIADNVPAAVTGVSVTCIASGTADCGTNGSSGNNVSFTAASLGPGAGNMLTLTVSGSVSTSASGTLVNTATVAAGAGATDLNLGNNSATDANQQTTGAVTEVASFFAYDAAFAGGVSVAAGDITGDGAADIVTGAGPGGGPHVRAFSLTGGAPTEVANFFAGDPAFAGGISVAAGDVTGDGVAEIITGTGPGGGSIVRAFSLVSGVVTQVASFVAGDPTLAGGINVAVGDVTGDGVGDIITGAGAGGGPEVRAFSLAGSTATEVANFLAYDAAFAAGISVAAADVTGDGVAEIITGAGPGGGPHVRAFSLAGSTATEVASFLAYDPSFIGGVHVAAADLSGDGVAELITGAGPGGGPHVRGFSLTSGLAEVIGLFAYDPAFAGGVVVAGQDLTGDGIADIITVAGPGGGPHVRVLDVSGVTVR